MKKLYTVLITILLYNISLANTFIVTTSADSGPGSLREAITLANTNGTTIVDSIYFNIPETIYNLRIINLVTELPSLSSNIIIDGTSQPGAAYGTTDAKICLKKNNYAPFFSMIKIENAQNVEVLGLQLYYGYWQGFFGTPARSVLLYGVNVINADHIRIGAPGKGNVIQGVVHCIYSDTELSSDITIQSNYLGDIGFYANSASDIDPVIVASQCGITIGSAKNIFIGGLHADEGNIFGCKTRGINIDSKNVTGNGFITIQHNLFGRKYDKVTLVNVYDFWDNYIHVGRSRNNPLNWTLSHTIDYKIKLLDNNIASHATISYVSDSIIIQRNLFEEDYRENGHPYKLIVSYSPGAGIIGGEDVANANYLKNKLANNSFFSMSIYQSGPITVLKNIFECNSLYGSTTWISSPFNVIPFAQVDLTTVDSVTGRATPNSRVDLYYDDFCSACEGLSYLATVSANTLGKWKYTGSTTGTVIATATSSAGYTGNFSAPTFNATNKILKNPTCGHNNGSITNITTEGAETYFWIKNYNQLDTAGHSLDLLNVGPGIYYLFGVHGGTCIQPHQTYTLEDVTPKIIATNAFVTQPSCGLFNGSVSGITISYGQYSMFKWINNSGQTIGTQLSINGLGAGTYRIVVTDTSIGGGCSDTATFVLTNQSGPTVNTNNIQLVAATCGNANGSITGITTANVTGIPFIRWVDSLNNPVGNNLNLLSVLPGKYRLKFKDATGCDTIITPFYVIADNGAIKIDVSNKLIIPSKCIGNTGSIQQILVTGGDNYTWINTANNATVGNSISVFNLPPGNYQLTVANISGCSKTSPLINLPQTTFVPITVTSFTKADAICQQQIGSIAVNAFSNNAALFSFKWIDSISGQPIGTGSIINNLAMGTYMLYATDSNGCERKIFSTQIIMKAVPDFDYSQVILTDEQCDQSNGSILSIKINGLTGPTTYSWINQNNNVVGSSINLQHAPQGTYILMVTDAGFCQVKSKPFTIVNNNIGLPQPSYNDLIISKNSNALLLLKDPAAGTYFLYNSSTSTQAIQQNNQGNFTITGIAADTSFYIKQVYGSCVSPFAHIKIKVIEVSYFVIPGAFTPDGNGVNDKLSVKAVGYINLNYFRIYNKWSELVFETRKMDDGWNGIYKGVLQNPGGYVWIAEGRDIRGNLITDKGSFILIR